VSYVRIVAPAPSEIGLTRTQGTKVLLEDGSELEGVYRIVLRAEVNDIWTAEIHCHPSMAEITAWASVHSDKPNWWSRLWSKLKGGDIDVTKLDSGSREYRKP
jgi:hypothetical protein